MSATTKTGRLEIRRTERDGEIHLVLEGQMDDQSDLAALLDTLRKPVVIDLKGVSFINSVGVREWIRFLHGLTELQLRVRLRQCSEAMILQMNMIMEARGSAEVESFYAPYTCEGCGLEASMCLDARQHAEALNKRQVPSLPCPDCGGTMQFDDFPKRYLLFLE
jgi:anti-anti-sigma regulatory factor